MKPLHKLSPRKRGRVVALTTDGNMRRRLQDLGIIEGTSVQKLYTAPLGDPSAYRVRGVAIALRKKDADTIYIQEK